LRADSLEVAESALRSKLCQIDELVPLSDEGQAVDVLRLESSFSQVDRIRRSLAIFLACVFLYSLITWWRAPSAPEAPEEVSSALSFVIRGRLASDALPSSLGGDLSEVQVHAIMPELPFEGNGDVDDDARFEIPVSLTAPGRPGRLLFEVSIEGRRWRVQQEYKVATQGDTDVGEIRPVRPDREEEDDSKISPPSASGAGTPDPHRKTPKEIKLEQKRRIDEHRNRRRRRPNA